jgi:Ca2+-binding RTX toxin-like protein
MEQLAELASGGIAPVGVGNDYLLGNAAIDTFVGGAGADYLRGSDNGAIAESVTNAAERYTSPSDRKNPLKRSGFTNLSMKMFVSTSFLSIIFEDFSTPEFLEDSFQLDFAGRHVHRLHDRFGIILDAENLFNSFNIPFIDIDSLNGHGCRHFPSPPLLD